MLQSVVFTITDRQLGYIIYIFYYVLELILYSSKNGATLTSQLLNRRRCNATSLVTLHHNHYFTLTLIEGLSLHMKKFFITVQPHNITHTCDSSRIIREDPENEDHIPASRKASIISRMLNFPIIFFPNCPFRAEKYGNHFTDESHKGIK